MKTTNKKITIMTSITITTLLIAGSSFMGMQNVYAPALVINGSFENGNPVCTATFNTLDSGGELDDIAGWTIGGNGIDWICGHWDASDGTHSLDMSALDAGTISQDLTTVVGAEYKVTFDMSGNPSGVPAVKSMTVSAADDSEIFTEDQGNASNDMAWQAKEFCFRATETTTTLEFASNDATNSGPALDNVAAELVVEIPGDGIDSNCDGLDYPTMYESENGLFWKEIDESCVDGLDIADDSAQDCDLWITFHDGAELILGFGTIVDTIPAHLVVGDVGICDAEFSNQKGKDSGKQPKKPRVTSSTKVTCDIEEGEMVHIDTTTRLSPSVEKSNKPNKVDKYSPTGCGEFEVNGGLIYYEEVDENGNPIVLDSLGPIFVHTTPDDLDCDGVENDGDNCVFVSNEDQADTDGDGAGDACDICQGSDDNLDADNDGVPDGCDVCDGNDASGDTDGDLVCDDIDPQFDNACIPDDQDPLCMN